MSGVAIISELTPYNDGDFALMDDRYLRGGYRVVADTTARDAIGSNFKKSGMVVYVVADSTEYRWDGTNWTAITTDSLAEGATNLYYTDARADARIIAQKGVADGLATLDLGGKIPTSQLPALAITDVFVVASEVAQLALTAEEGDVAVRTDIDKSYIHNGGSAGTMADWQELLTPTDTVLSVNGQTGTVNLTTTSITEGTNLYYTDARVNTRLATLFASQGFMVKTETSYAVRSIIGFDKQISVSNGDGAAGNPQLSLSATLELPGTLKAGGHFNLDGYNITGIGTLSGLLSSPISLNSLLSSTYFKTQKIIDYAAIASGSFPYSSGTFVYGGGTLLITVSGSGYRSGSVGLLGVTAKIRNSANSSDVLTLGEVKTYTNELASHKSIIPRTFVVTTASLAAGTYRIRLELLSGVTTDSNDFFDVTITELPI